MSQTFDCAVTKGGKGYFREQWSVNILCVKCEMLEFGAVNATPLGVIRNKDTP